MALAWPCFDGHAERHRVVLVKEAVVEVGAGPGATVLVAVGQEMLQQRRGHPRLRVVALQALGVGRGQRAHQERVLAVRLFGAAPARIAAQVGVGRAHHQPALMELVVGPARLVGLFRRRLLQQLGVPRLAQPVRLRELRGRRHQPASAPSSRPAQRQSVQPLHMVRPNDAETRNGGIGAQHRQLLVQRHALDQVGDALLRGKLRILIGQELGRRAAFRRWVPQVSILRPGTLLTTTRRGCRLGIWPCQTAGRGLLQRMRSVSWRGPF